MVGCTVREYYTPCSVDSTWVVLRALLIRLQAHGPRDRLVIVASLCDAFRVLCVCGWSDKDSTVPASQVQERGTRMGVSVCRNQSVDLIPQHLICV